MNYLSIVIGLIAIAYGLAGLAHQLRPANRAAGRVLKEQGDTAALAAHMTSMVTATVTPIAIGIAFAILGAMGRSLFPFSLFGW